MTGTLAKAHEMIGYAAFLRGINLAGHKAVNMGELKKAFESMGFQNVRTLLNSGNVLFEARKTARGPLVKTIEVELKTAFGHEIAVILRTIAEIHRLVESAPFEKVKVTPQTRLYVTLLSEKTNSSLKIPYESPEKDFKIVTIQPAEVFSVVTITPGRGTTEAMSFLEKHFGKRVTTRNWNTITKVLKK